MRMIVDLLVTLGLVFGAYGGAKGLHDNVLKALAEKHKQGFSSSESFAQALTGKTLEWTKAP